MERKEMIEKMAKIITKTYEKYGVFNPKWFAEAIYDKIFPDGAVVLTKGEIGKAVEERTIAIIKDLIGHRFAYYMKDETNGTVTCCADYVVDEDDVKFLKEKYLDEDLSQRVLDNVEVE